MKKSIWKIIPTWMKFIILKNYDYPQSILERVKGLDYLFKKCKDKTILDLGCADGLISYECARNGAKLVHGFDISKPAIKFAKKLFTKVPIKNKFIQYNLCLPSFFKENRRIMLKKYDYVLYLAIYGHLKNYMSKKQLTIHFARVLDLVNDKIAFRTYLLDEMKPILKLKGFKQVYQSKKNKIYIFKKQ